ncbi:expressed unknown protein [Seminavis robusta]|uniref:Uncharacterized protein n=1 Tax=Seminavis robusta TaxID=568900 RepID=A0A9N8HLF7_9STRA|nr:expressed unknown protein [Seminavis robusta]|eukprot:Sro817_g206770.1 n/a (380) ;mRNA; f:7018-8157
MADLRNRLRDLGVPDDVPVQGGNDVEIRDEGNGILFIGFGHDNDCYLSFHDLTIVIPLIGHRFHVLWVDVDDDDIDLQGWGFPQNEADQLILLFQTCFPNLKAVSLYGMISDETRTSLVQSLPRRVVSLGFTFASAVTMFPTAMSTISDRYPGLKSLEFSYISFDLPGQDTVPFFESVKKLIQDLPSLQNLKLDHVESTQPEDWSLVTEAILAHPNLKKLKFRADHGFDGFDETTERAIVRHLGENRLKATLRPADNTGTTFDLHRWVVTAAAFRNQSGFGYLFSPEVIDPCVLAQSALDQLRFRAATKKYFENELGKIRVKLAQTQEPPCSWICFETMLVAKLNALESGSQASASVSQTTEDLQRLERAQVFEYEAAD